MTAVLAAIGRAILGAVLVLAMLAAALWTAVRPEGLWTVLWLAAMGVTITVAGTALLALWPEKGAERRG